MKLYMLKFILMSLLCVLALSLTSCAKKNEAPVRYEDSNVKVSEYITAQTEFSEYDGDVKKIKVTFTNSHSKDGGAEGHVFNLLKQEGDKWRIISDKSGSNYPADAIIIPANGMATNVYDLEKYYDLPLSSGVYRIKVIADGLVYAEFTVK